MTEKRFTIDDESDIIEFDYNTNEYIQDFRWADGKSWDRICNKLNEQHKEIQEYEQLITELTDVKNKYKNENEQLKQEKDYYKRELQKELVCQAIIEGRERMTEKRFHFHLSEDAETMWVSDVKTHKEIDFGFRHNAKLLTNLLNSLNDENEQLKSEIEELENENEILEGKLWNCQNFR